MFNIKKTVRKDRLFTLVPVVGLEPTRHRWQRILSPPRLPFQHTGVFTWGYYSLSPLCLQDEIVLKYLFPF